MSLISTWSTDPDDNQGSTPNFWPEGQAPSTVNNCARSLMSAVRAQWNDAAWFDWGYNVSRVSGTSFLVTSATRSTVTLPAAFEANARIKLYDSTTIYGTITTVSASAASTLVTFDPDAFSLTSSFTSVYNSIIPATNTPIPGLNIPTDVVTQTTQQIYGVDNGATNSAHINLSPVLPGYQSGQLVLFKALQTNTGPATIQIGALGNKTIKKNVSEDLAAGDITAGQIVPLSYDGTNFQVVGGSGGASGTGTAVVQEITQNAHGFVVGEVLYLNSSTYTKAIATSAAAAEAVGMVTEVIDTNTFGMTTDGKVTGLTGLSSGNVYFVSPSSAGAITATEPTIVGQISKPVFVADSTTSGYFINYRGMIVPSATPTGTILQVVQGTLTTTATTSSTTFADSGITVSITPSSASSKVLAVCYISNGTDPAAAQLFLRLVRDSTSLSIGDAASNRTRISAGSLAVAGALETASIVYLDSPATTAAVTYKIQFASNSGGACYVNRGTSDTDVATIGRAASSIIVMEVSG